MITRLQPNFDIFRLTRPKSDFLRPPQPKLVVSTLCRPSHCVSEQRDHKKNVNDLPRKLNDRRKFNGNRIKTTGENCFCRVRREKNKVSINFLTEKKFTGKTLINQHNSTDLKSSFNYAATKLLNKPGRFLRLCRVQVFDHAASYFSTIKRLNFILRFDYFFPNGPRPMF